MPLQHIHENMLERLRRETSRQYIDDLIQRIRAGIPGIAEEIRTDRISSGEHGLLRGKDAHTGNLQGNYLMARGEADAPEIDGRVYVRGKLPMGNFARVKVVGHTDYALIAEPAS